MIKKRQWHVFEGSLLLPFYTNDTNRNNETMNDIQNVGLLNLDDNVWTSFVEYIIIYRFEMMSPLGIHLWWIEQVMGGLVQQRRRRHH